MASVVLKKLTKLCPTSACAFSKQNYYHTGYGFVKSFRKSMIDDAIRFDKYGEGVEEVDNKRHLNMVFNKGFINHYSHDDCISLVENRPRNYFDAYDHFLSALYLFIDTIHPLSATRILKRNLNIKENDIKLWDVKETTVAVSLIRKTPGDVQVSIEKNTPLSDKSIDDNPGFFYFENIFGYARTFHRMVVPCADLTIKVKREKKISEEEEERYCKPYGVKIALPGKIFKTNEIKIERNNDVLKVIVPKAEVKRVDTFKFMILS